MMMKPVDINAQCIVDDAEGHWFLCPAYKRVEEEQYFKSIKDAQEQGDFYIPVTFEALKGN